MIRALPLLALLALLACAPADEPAEQPVEERGESSAPATAADDQSWPSGWEARLDHPDRGAREDIAFQTMEPGWHITTGPAAVLYDPGKTGTGTYQVEAEVFLFDPGERREGYGVFIGGQDLQGAGQRYTYFLLRRDGRFLIKRRDGESTPTVQDWTEHPAIVSWEEREEGAETVKNVIVVDVGADEVVFTVNGEEVARQSREALDTEGVVGLRVNHSLDLHVARLDVRTNGGGNP